MDKGPVLYYWMFRHERYWGLLISWITRMSEPEIGITMALSRRLRPLVLRGMVRDCLLEVVMGRAPGNVSAASYLLKQTRDMDTVGQNGWMGAYADRSAVARQGSIVCALDAKEGRRYRLSSTEKRIIATHMSMTEGVLDSLDFIVHGCAYVQGGRFDSISTQMGSKYPCKAFVEMRYNQDWRGRGQRGRWWGLVTKFISCVGQGLGFAFLRVFPSRPVRASMGNDASLGQDFVLDGLVIPRDAFDFRLRVNQRPDFVVPITSIWSQCIAVPWFGTDRASHIIFPTRRELYI